MASDVAPSNPGFGNHFSAHVAVARYGSGAWGDWSLEIFEGLKAFRQPDDTIALFRPDDNAERFDGSARRMAMPPLPAGVFRAACEAVVRADADYVSSRPDESLYLRPMMFASEPALGVRPATEYLFVVLASPVGAYFGDGVRPITVWADPTLVRAAPGGTGAAKCSGNYGASLIAKREAVAQGCDEAIWLDAIEHRFVEELGGMNFMAVANGGTSPVVVTPPLSDTILDGVTRRSLLELTRARGYATAERPITLTELISGGFTEAFACGTAAVIAPIGAVQSAEGAWSIGDGNPGSVTLELRDALVSLQEGRADDPFGWRAPLAL